MSRYRLTMKDALREVRGLTEDATTSYPPKEINKKKHAAYKDPKKGEREIITKEADDPTVDDIAKGLKLDKKLVKKIMGEVFDYDENILDEIQPGSYIFMDSHYSAINNFEDSPEFEQSLYVLGSIMSINSESIILDVGTKSISVESGFPKLFDDNNAKTIQVSDEHIVIKCDTKKYKLAEKVLLIPSHCDPTVNLHEKFNIINDKLEVVDSWKILARGMHF